MSAGSIRRRRGRKSIELVGPHQHQKDKIGINDYTQLVHYKRNQGGRALLGILMLLQKDPLATYMFDKKRVT